MNPSADLADAAHLRHLSDALNAAMDGARKECEPSRTPAPFARARGWLFAVPLFRSGYFRLGGHSQQIDDVGLAFEGPWISLDEAMIDRNLADLAKLVFADTDVRKAAG
jgi:hypothetical protein